MTTKAQCEHNFECEFYTFIRPNQDSGAVAKNATISPRTAIEPAALRFRCSAQTN